MSNSDKVSRIMYLEGLEDQNQDDRNEIKQLLRELRG